MDAQLPTAGGEARRVIRARGLFLSELETDVVYEHRPGRTITEADNVLFSAITMNGQALHLDEAWSSTQPFGQRLVNSLCTLSVMVGLSVAQITQGTIVANLGFSEVKFGHPVFHGDTLYCDTVIVATRPSATRPGEGIATMTHTARNQDGVVVATATRSVLMRIHPDDDEQ